MHDVHYYIPHMDAIFNEHYSDSMCAISGNQYRSIPGRTALPWGEGYVTISVENGNYAPTAQDLTATDPRVDPCEAAREYLYVHHESRGAGKAYRHF